jgi:hypothetical protein
MASDKRRAWAEVFVEELEELKRRRTNRVDPEQTRVGLAISGGGIRSATFALGVLESLRRKRLLQKLDYLSTVSGGGYIGAWLSANCKRHTDWLEPTADWTASIAHLRRYSNYLSPKVGFFSADTWSMGSIWLRNTLLIQITVILAIACALLLPRPLLELLHYWPQSGNLRWVTILLFILGVVGIGGNLMRLTSHGAVWILRASNWPYALIAGAALIGVAWGYGKAIAFDPFHGGAVNYWQAAPIAALLVLAGFVLQPVAVRTVGALWRIALPQEPPPEQINYTQAWVQAVVVIPLMIAALLVAAVLWGEAIGAEGGFHSLNSYGQLVTGAWRYWPFPLSVVFVSFWLLSFCSVRSRGDKAGLFIATLTPAIAVPVLHALLCVVMVIFLGWAEAPGNTWKAFVWGPPLVAFAFVLSIMVLIGMMSRQSTEEVREWWSRLGAWLGIYATAWMVMTVSATYATPWVNWAVDEHPWKSLFAGGGWIGTVAAGLFAGNSPSTDGTGDKSAGAKVKEIFAAVAPFLFIGGLLIAVSYALDTIIQLNAGRSWPSVGVPEITDDVFLLVSFATLAGCTLALLLMAARVDINQFSLNAFYRNRLVRCYLGATRFTPGERNPQNFTGFDEDDDVALAALAGVNAPLHIVNCALNLGGSSDLALHTRHSAAFTLTPFYCGSAYPSRNQKGELEQLGFIATREYGGEFGAPTLGQAISVSGAAASPNMGYHTSPVTAFLLTLFNVRLGWWFPNPSKTDASSASPPFSLTYLFAELFGGAADKARFVSISDGGHFENLAAYELIRRKCRVIIISDGECDVDLTFAGLGTLIRMCEVDFGAKITIDVSAIRRAGSTWSTRRWAIGSIDYGDGSPDGVLIYLKAAMTGREDTAVLQYKSSHPPFPHETTGDQFYGEDQFESYRSLGRDIGRDAFESFDGSRDIAAFAAEMLASASAEHAATATVVAQR